MTFRRIKDSEYDRTLQTVFDLSTNRLTDIGAVLHYHDDIVNSEDYNWPEGEPHPVDLLEAQMDLQGAEEEAEATRDLVNILGHLIVLRKSRQQDA
jgi:hypothetical protein